MLKSYHLRLSAGETGPFTEAQIAQLIADGRANRDTQCRPTTESQWKTIDEYLPMLKYGTQLPAPSPKPTVTQAQRPISIDSGGVRVTDVDIPFGSLLKLGFKALAAWWIVLLCYTPLIILFYVVFFAIVALLLGSSLPQLPHK